LPPFSTSSSQGKCYCIGRTITRLEGEAIAEGPVGLEGSCWARRRGRRKRGIWVYRPVRSRHPYQRSDGRKGRSIKGRFDEAYVSMFSRPRCRLRRLALSAGALALLTSQVIFVCLTRATKGDASFGPDPNVCRLVPSCLTPRCFTSSLKPRKCRCPRLF
jgi:hypothetical protein